MTAKWNSLAAFRLIRLVRDSHFQLSLRLERLLSPDLTGWGQLALAADRLDRAESRSALGLVSEVLGRAEEDRDHALRETALRVMSRSLLKTGEWTWGNRFHLERTKDPEGLEDQVFLGVIEHFLEQPRQSNADFGRAWLHALGEGNCFAVAQVEATIALLESDPGNFPPSKLPALEFLQGARFELTFEQRTIVESIRYQVTRMIRDELLELLELAGVSVENEQPV